MELKGKFIVIEGTDGSGKTTQVELLTQELKQKNVPYEVIDFPRYDDNPYGALVGRYLKGEFGGLYQVSPYLASLPYTMDRLLALPLINEWISVGKLVIANRYVSANKGHMAAKLPVAERVRFIKWIDRLEYETNKIPKPDLTLLLFLPAELGQMHVDKRGKGRDIHERNLKYQGDTADIFLHLAKTEPNWIVIDCFHNGSIKSREEIHKQIMQVLAERKIIL